MPKIVFVTHLDRHHIERVEQVAPGWTVIAGKKPDEWQAHLREAEIIGGWHSLVESECLGETKSNLRWLHNWGAGVDQIPFDALARHHVMLTNSSGVHANPISETIIGLMLMLTRKLHTYVRNQLKHTWHHANVSMEMHGKTAGILGVGAIGSETARICKAFGMHVIGLRKSGRPSEYVDDMVDYADLTKLLSQSDYVINTLPLTSETNHFIDANAFGAMKKHAFYINIGRGQTTDEAALVAALRDGQIAGAGLDVFEEEPLPDKSPLWDMENVIITPHSSGSNEHYTDRVLDILVPNLAAYVRGEEPNVNRVDLNKRY